MARIAIAGGGIIGLACALRLAGDGHAVTLIDPDPDGDKCSWGNAGGIANTEVVPAPMPGMVWRVPGWLFDPLGPVALRWQHAPALLPWLLGWLQAGRAGQVERIAAALAGLLGRVDADLEPLLAQIGCIDDWHRLGALAVYRSAAGLRADRAGWALRQRHGIAFDEISGAEARALEPALDPGIAAGVFMPGWSHVSDPKLIWAALLAAVRAAGVAVVRSRVTDIARKGRVRLASGREIACDAVVVAAGAWSAALARSAGDRVLLESERGYNVTLPDAQVHLSREVIFAERSFVATPLCVGLRIGGAAEFAGLSAPPNYARSRALGRLARDYLPGVNLAGGREWMGNRPATPDSLPVIGPSPRRADVVYAFGHGHLGLTLAATTAQLVGDRLSGQPPKLDLAPFSAGRFG
jgi:D-amino-acid dehydrogenase